MLNLRLEVSAKKSIANQKHQELIDKADKAEQLLLEMLSDGNGEVDSDGNGEEDKS